MEKRFENEYFKLKIDDGILTCEFAAGVELDIEVAQVSVKERLKLQDGEAVPLLIKMLGLKSATRKAREYLAVEGVYLLTAAAVIVKRPLGRMLGNLLILLIRPKIPAKIFTDEMQARKWLKKYQSLA
jgi:hypothetical protein